jgi:hypothetical protein
MDTTPPLTPADLFAHVIAEMVRSISDRPGETKEQCFIRTQLATRMILGLGPRDIPEAMLAGQAVMFHALTTDSVHRWLRGETEAARRGAGAQIVALNRMFHQNLNKLDHYQERRPAAPGPGEAEVPKPAAPAAPAGTVTARTSGTAVASPEPVVSHQSPAVSDQLPPPPLPEPPCANSGAAAFADTAEASHRALPGPIDPPAETAPAQGAVARGTDKPPAPLNRAQRRQLRHGRMA